MIALYFSILPNEAGVFLREDDEYNKEVERQQQDHYEELKRYVRSLKKEDLQRELYNALLELEERRSRYW